MNMLNRMLGRGKADDTPRTIKLEATPGENARAYRRRVARAERAAPIPVLDQGVPLSEAEEARLRRQIAKIRGIDADKVDLDEISISSGAQLRALRRRKAADERRKRQRARRRFSRQERRTIERRDKAQAMGEVAANGIGAMADNVRNHLERQASLSLAAQRSDAKRAARREAHEARRAELGQTPDGRRI